MYSLVQTAMEKVSARIAVSEAARQTLVEHIGGDAVLIPNGVDCSAFGHGDPLPGWPGDGGSLFFIGRIDEPRKGLQVLLEALPAIAAAHPRRAAARRRPRRRGGVPEGPVAGGRASA